ncbi:hypothetical protein LJC31_06090 [Synergistaceae bacterium OttesenSCG-928-I11]|nr:hypothetical protein [Synergistaceae bacterium OttesenSCG-928-I11]
MNDLTHDLARFFVAHRRFARFIAASAFAMLLLANFFLYNDYRSLPLTAAKRGEMRSGEALWIRYMMPRFSWEEERTAWTEDASRAFASLQTATTARTGHYVGDADLPRAEPLVVDATRMKTDVQLLLLHSMTMRERAYIGEVNPSRSVSVFARAGERAEVSVPAGSYNVVIVTGTRWSGDEYGLFPTGVGRSVRDAFEFGGVNRQLVEADYGHEVRSKEKKFRGYRFAPIPNKDGTPGFREVKMNQIKKN